MSGDGQTIKVRRHREEERVIYAGAPAPAPGAQASHPAPSAPTALDGAAPSAPDEHPEPADAFRETTLDDIESSTMSGLQKGIIVGAVLLIAACIAWYVLFMS